MCKCEGERAQSTSAAKDHEQLQNERTFSVLTHVRGLQRHQRVKHHGSRLFVYVCPGHSPGALWDVEA